MDLKGFDNGITQQNKPADYGVSALNAPFGQRLDWPKRKTSSAWGDMGQRPLGPHGTRLGKGLGESVPGQSVRVFLRLNLLLLLSKRRVSLGSLSKAHPNCRHIDKRSPKLGIRGRLSFRHAMLCLAAVFIRFHLSIPGR